MTDWPVWLYIVGITLGMVCFIIGAFIDETNTDRRRRRK
jgi:hypothetical protein